MLNTSLALVGNLPGLAMLLLAEGEKAAPGEPAEKLNTFQQLLRSPLPLIIGLLVIWYVTMILPERRKRAEEQQLMAALKKNDRIITIGGIHATVVDASQTDVVTVKIDDSGKTRMKVNRTAIAKVHNKKQEKKESQESSDKDSE